MNRRMGLRFKSSILLLWLTISFYGHNTPYLRGNNLRRNLAGGVDKILLLSYISQVLFGNIFPALLQALQGILY